MRRAGYVLTIATALVALVPRGASAAQLGAGGGTTDTSIGAWVASGSSGGSWEQPSSGVTCTFEIPNGAPEEVYKVIDGVDYLLHFRRCSDGTLEMIWVPQLTGQDLAAMARDEVRRLLPAPRTEFAPAADQVVVQVGTWVWADPAMWQPVTATAAIPGLTATVTATPERLRFDPGDGGHGTGPITCDGPGEVWQPSFGDEQPSRCMYTYRHASSLAASGTWPSTTTITWDVRYSASDGSTGDLGTLTTSATQPITVGEIEALVTG